MRGTIGFVILVLSLTAITEANHKYLYGCVIDAGSSGSRIYIYTWLHRNNNTLPNLNTAPLNQTQWSKKVSPGLSKYATNLTGIPDYLSGLISYATGLLPSTEISETPLYLKATGGLRALGQADQDAIMTNTRRYLHTTPFSFQDSYAQVIPLETESLFGWIAANYLKGLAGSSALTAGALDMGGASTEIAFVSAATQNYSTVSLGEGYTYTVFASGFNARGQDDAFAITNAFLGNGRDATMPIEHPCYNVGYNETWPLSSTVSYQFYGTGNLAACRQLVSAALLNTSVPCPASPCSFEGHYQPTLPTNMDFFAYSAFAYTYQAYFPTVTSVRKVSLASFDTANADWCSQNYTYIRSLFTTTAQPDALLKRYCWSGSYFTQLLTVYGFQPNVENIYFGTSVNNIEITWALGSMLSDAALLPYSPNPVLTTTTGPSSDVSRGYCLSGLLVILVACLML